MTTQVAAGIEPASCDDALETATMRKVTLRFMPFILASYVVCYLDRVNVGFAALTANHDLGLTPTTYGWGAGIFFLGYFIFEYPSNIILHKVGARTWIARIMITWGIVSAAMALVVGPLSFFIARFLLGAAEAGFFPGIMLFMTYWFPRRYRARRIMLFMLGVPISSLIGGIISGSLLGLDGVLGLKGWQWLYIVEAAPAVVLGVATLMVFTDRPGEASWLDAPQRDWLMARLNREAAGHAHRTAAGFFRTLRDRRVLFFSAVFFNVTAASYGLTLWLPQIIKKNGLTNMQTGLISALPFLVGSIAMFVWARRSDRQGERVWHTAACAFIMAAGLVLCVLVQSTVLQVLAISIATVGVYGIKGPFLAMTTEAFSGPGTAGSLAMVSALGNLSGFLPPFVIGWLRSGTGSFSPGLLLLAGLALAGGLQVVRSAPYRSAGAG